LRQLNEYTFTIHYCYGVYREKAEPGAGRYAPQVFPDFVPTRAGSARLHRFMQVSFFILAI
jgi:hypothetical protein